MIRFVRILLLAVVVLLFCPFAEMFVCCLVCCRHSIGGGGVCKADRGIDGQGPACPCPADIQVAGDDSGPDCFDNLLVEDAFADGYHHNNCTGDCDGLRTSGTGCEA